MNTLTRKQRELQQREQLFLDTARQVIREHGVSGLTMEIIAEITEYSKGTVYKHFTCKEDIMCALCADGIEYLLTLLNQMMNFEGRPREKSVIIALSYLLYAERYPEEFDLILAARNTNIRQKASPERLEASDNADERITHLIKEQIRAAIKCGDLKLQEGVTVDQLCLGPWALSLGMIALYEASDLISSIEFSPMQETLYQQLNFLLDGYQWHPLSAEFDYRKTICNATKLLENNTDAPSIGSTLGILK
ncbi:MAG: TetR/AcrR family transcriptional regulator [Pseudomonadales bacterium]|nr:TetR/AcrR family transcriptional regulator [Pseudomonadales bacterium]